MVKRVVVVTESFLPAINGVTNSVLRVLETFKQRDIEAVVVAPTAPTPKHLGFPVVKTASIPVKQFQVGMPGLWLQDIIEDFTPDVVHVASPFLLGGAAIAAASRVGVPSVAIYQTQVSNYLERYRLPAIKPLFDRTIAAIHAPATLNLAPTPESEKYLRSLGIGSVAIWGRGVDLDLFHPDRKSQPETAELRRKLAPNGEILVGYVGRLAAEKQVERMAELFDIPGTRFVVVGDGPEKRNLEQAFAGAADRVVFTGSLKGLELAAAYAAMDVFVHFGTDETFGQTIQEAQAAGLPVVAPARGGPLHLIESGENGFLVEPTDSLPYRRRVSALAEDDSLRARVGETARRSVANKSWDANNAALLDYYTLAMDLQSLRMESTIELA
jgi:phosphatidylinositol alpha 1,6-mannosyltransferase